MRTWLMVPFLLLSSVVAQDTAPQTASLNAALTLSAPVGSSTELLLTMTRQVTVSELRVYALAGTSVSESTLNRVRRDLNANLNTISRKETRSGKAFFKVAERSPSGDVTLVTTLITGEQGLPAVTQRFTENIPVTSATLSELTQSSELLRSSPAIWPVWVGEPGLPTAGLYGQTFSTESTPVAISAQGLLRSLLGLLAGPQTVDQLLKQADSSWPPLKAMVTSQGLDAQGNHRFDVKGALTAWQTTLTVKVDTQNRALPEVRVRVTQLDWQGQHTYRPDGLPGPSIQSAQLTAQVTLILEGVQVALTLKQDTKMALESRR